LLVLKPAAAVIVTVLLLKFVTTPLAVALQGKNVNLFVILENVLEVVCVPPEITGKPVHVDHL
jgi:hypothetical protein